MQRQIILSRSLRLRCPRCGGDRLFSGPFRMRERCRKCGLPFAREPGFYLGSIYVNYGLTALLVTIGYFALFFSAVVLPDTALRICLAFCLLFPLWFFRYARSLWLGMDFSFDPPSEDTPVQPTVEVNPRGQ